jgi:hypothetical protein
MGGDIRNFCTQKENPKKGARFYLADIWRLRGEVFLLF